MLESLESLGLDDQGWDALAASLPAGHRRAVAFFARALADPHRETTRYMERIDAEEPGSPQLTKLLIRALRAVDEVKLARVLAGYAASAADDQKVDDLRAFVRGVAARGREWSPGVWIAASAHLSLVRGNAAESASTLDAALPLEPGFSATARGALAVERLLTAVALGREETEVMRLLPGALSAVDAAARDGDTAPRETVLGTLGVRRLGLDDVPRAALAFSAAGYTETVRFILDMYASADELASLSSLLQSPSDPESAAGAARFPFSADDIAYMRGVRLIRVGAYGAAEKAFAALPGAFWARAAGKKIEPLFDDRFGGAPMGSVWVAWGDTRDPAMEPEVVRRDVLAHRLAELERAGNPERLGWAWLSTPFIGYDDLLWNGEMVEVLKRATLDGWPFMSRGLSAKAADRLKSFLDEYDSHAAAARYLKRALAAQRNPEKAARVALGLWRSLAEPSYSDSMGSPSHAAAGEAEQVAMTIVQKYGRTAAVADYRNSYGDGCPGLGASRVGLSALRGLGQPRPPWLR
jgi:hypothetical protein